MQTLYDQQDAEIERQYQLGILCDNEARFQAERRDRIILTQTRPLALHSHQTAKDGDDAHTQSTFEERGARVIDQATKEREMRDQDARSDDRRLEEREHLTIEHSTIEHSTTEQVVTTVIDVAPLLEMTIFPGMTRGNVGGVAGIKPCLWMYTCLIYHSQAQDKASALVRVTAL